MTLFFVFTALVPLSILLGTFYEMTHDCPKGSDEDGICLE